MSDLIDVNSTEVPDWHPESDLYRGIDMDHTEPPRTAPAPAVYGAIAAVQAELSRQGIAKDRRNKEQGYAFRGIDDVYNAVSGLLASNGLCILPYVTERTMTERQTQAGKPLFLVVVCVDFEFVSAKDGSRHTVRTYGEAMDTADKATNKAQSAAYKYALLQTFAIPTEAEENDADERTHKPAPAQAQQSQARQPLDEAARARDRDEISRLLTSTGTTPSAFRAWIGHDLENLPDNLVDRALAGLRKKAAAGAATQREAA